MKKGTRVFDLLFNQYKNFPQEVCLSSKVNGKWKSYSTKQVIGISSRLALGLVELGVKKGDRIGQLVFSPTIIAQVLEVFGNLKETTRGAGGFGSTGL